MKQKISIIIISFLLLPNFVLAAPSVSTVSGTISDGQTITIAGTDFGADGPHVVVFDDFESGTPGANIATGSGSARYGQWVARSGSSFYGTSARVSGSKAFNSDYSEGYVNYIEATLPANTKDVFISWWLYLPAGNYWPGETDTYGTNWKQMWIQGADTGDDDLVVPTIKNGTQIVGNDKASCQVNCLDGYAKYIDFNITKGQWKRAWVWVKGSSGTDTQDGQTKFYELEASGVTTQLNDLTASNLKTGGYRERVRPNGYGRTQDNCTTSFDDIYIATGENGQSRVEIGTGCTGGIYNNCTNLTILTLASWSDTAISATVNAGSISDGSAYLFVIDNTGTPSPGKSITFGGGGDTLAPGSPGGLSVY